jgi:hypothetical protein
MPPAIYRIHPVNSQSYKSNNIYNKIQRKCLHGFLFLCIINKALYVTKNFTD